MVASGNTAAGRKITGPAAAAMPGWCLKTALGQGPGNPRAPFESGLRAPASPAQAGQIQTKHGHRCPSEVDLGLYLRRHQGGD